MSLGEFIIELRESAELSQRKMAERLGVDPSYLSRLERGKREPSIAFLRKLASETSTPLALLIALSLVDEIPEAQRGSYEEILGKLNELAKTRQTELDLDGA